MVTKAQLLLAQNTPDVANADTVEDYSDEDVRSSPTPTTASVARSGVRSVGVYKLTPTGCQRVMVAAHSLAQVLRDGYSPVCFDCGTDTCGVIGHDHTFGRVLVALRYRVQTLLERELVQRGRHELGVILPKRNDVAERSQHQLAGGTELHGFLRELMPPPARRAGGGGFTQLRAELRWRGR